MLEFELQLSTQCTSWAWSSTCSGLFGHRDCARALYITTGLFWAKCPISWAQPWPRFLTLLGWPQAVALAHFKAALSLWALSNFPRWGQWVMLVLLHLLDDALWWHSPLQAIALCGSLYTALGFGVAGCLQKPASVLSPTLQCSMTTFLRAKAKVSVQEDELTKQRLGSEHETSLSTREMFCLILMGLSAPWKDVSTMSIERPEDFRV